MTTRPRVQVWSDRRMVTLQGDVIPQAPGETVLLHGETDGRGGGAMWVRFDDGREVLIAAHDVEVLR